MESPSLSLLRKSFTAENSRRSEEFSLWLEEQRHLDHKAHLFHESHLENLIYMVARRVLFDQ